MGYELLTTPPARKAIKRLPRDIRTHLVKTARELSNNPYLGERLERQWRFLHSLHTTYKGTHYRIAYEVPKGEKQVIIHLIGSRENFYEKLRRLHVKRPV